MILMILHKFVILEKLLKKLYKKKVQHSYSSHIRTNSNLENISLLKVKPTYSLVHSRFHIPLL